jgi:microcompartment protein CcmK/EutM
MIIAKVMGTAVASIKHDALQTAKILLVCQTDASGNVSSEPFLAVDLVGSGEGELVIVSQGSSARLATGHKESPVDAAIIGILNSLHYKEETIFRKE